MSDDDPKTIDHEKYERSPKGRKIDRRVFWAGGIFVAFLWLQQWYFEGWDSFAWGQIVLGIMTAVVVFGPIVHYSDIHKPLHSD